MEEKYYTFWSHLLRNTLFRYRYMMEDSLKVLARFLEDFSFTFKLALLYPKGHSLVLNSVKRVLPILSGILALEDSLFLGITPDGVSYGEKIIETKRKEVREFCSYLHGLEIGGIRLCKGLGMEEFENFLETITSQEEALKSSKFPHITLVYLNYEQLFKALPEEATSLASKKDIWRFLLVTEPEIPIELAAEERDALKDLTQDPQIFGKLASDVIAPWVTPEGSPLLQFQSDVLQKWLEMLSNLIGHFMPDDKKGFLYNLSRLLLTLDPALSLTLFSQDGVMQSALECLSPKEIADLSLRLISMEGGISPRLSKVFTKVFTREEERKEVLSLMEDRVKEGPLKEGFLPMKQLIFSLDERDFMSEGYEASLEAIDPYISNSYRTSFQKQEEYSLLRKYIYTLIALLEEEIEPEAYLEIASDLKGIAKDSILSGHFSLGSKILLTFREHYDSNILMPKETLLILKGFLEDFKDADIVQGLLSAIPLVSEEEFNGLKEIFSQLGMVLVRGLLDLLCSGRGQKARRRVKAILSSLGEEALPSLFPLLSQRDPVFLRDILEIMGNIGHKRSLNYLKKFMNNNNLLLRLEAVKSMGKIGGREGVALLIEALKDRDEEVRKVATLYISRVKDQEGIQWLISQASKRSFFGLILNVELVRLLGQMKSMEAVPFLENILKKRLLLGKRKIYQAAINALARIGKGDALRVLRKGEKSKRNIVRNECQKQLKMLSKRLQGNA